MPKFAANLSFMFTEWDFLDRFAAAADAGFDAVEYFFPFDYPPETLAAALSRHGLSQVLFNFFPGDWEAGERGLAAMPGREAVFAATIDQALRCYRVVVDIGMHLGLRIPESESFHPGEVWDHDLGVEFGILSAGQEPDFLRSEVVRYLGWPAQAISYKVGEREWLRAREAARSRFGKDFDLQRFHTAALDLGPLPLSMLEGEVARALGAGKGAS